MSEALPEIAGNGFPSSRNAKEDSEKAKQHRLSFLTMCLYKTGEATFVNRKYRQLRPLRTKHQNDGARWKPRRMEYRHSKRKASVFSGSSEDHAEFVVSPATGMYSVHL